MTKLLEAIVEIKETNYFDKIKAASEDINEIS